MTSDDAMDERMDSVTSSTSFSRHSSPSPSLTNRALTPDPEDVEIYQSLMSSLFPSDSLPPPPQPIVLDDAGEDGDDGMITEGGVKRAMTKAEKQNAKKKRRKERERAMKLEIEQAAAKSVVTSSKVDEDQEQAGSMIDFRLWSSCPIKPVSVLPQVEEWAVPSNPRFIPLDDERAFRIRQVAQAVAVDYPNLGGPSVVHEKWTKTRTCPRSVIAQDIAASNMSEMFIGVISRDRHGRSSDDHVPATITTKSNGKSIKSIPTIPLTITPSSARSLDPNKKSTTRRGRRRRRSDPHPPARFWAPPPGLGGKARGYAWGYRDSMEGRREEGAWPGYVRSKDR
ncbi:hypothetical protein CI109_100701 [Kwoniella shandongensis]|uniref:Uncharacterized protein n=1 Tax=Kwoniella shandongensis TaxID=1734106 RepID=A0A5M6C0L9_9TREE|nr:uncharacterized protein CI109_003378 [Kwoniella shandongensis]KAA5528090.1 hypothetical protein CI109_003378 [Kwoniella shandongensis]